MVYQWFISKKTINFQGGGGGGGSNRFQGWGGGGPNANFYRKPIELVIFQGGLEPLSPLWIRACLRSKLIR